MISKEIVTQLAELMVRPEGSSGSFGGETAIPAGQTYIGQMISHDIVEPTTKDLNTRTVTPRLNLDSIYGSAPLYLFSHSPEKTGFLDKGGKFPIHIKNGVNDFIRMDKSVSRAGDKQRSCSFKAIIPEQRNDENVIVSQLHIFWQQLHNILIDHYTSDALEARRLVTLLFQTIVVEEFLRYILSKNIYKKILHHHERYLKVSGIPDYFSKASYRFGHSLIRIFYKLRDKNRFNLVELFRREQKLEAIHVIDWTNFFSKNKQKTVPLDTQISSPMSTIPGSDNPDIAIHIAEKNINAGIDVNLPSGVEFTKRLIQENAKISTELHINPLSNFHGASFEALNLDIEDLPLWPYLLLEAQKIGMSSKLGPLGSLLNAEVLRWSMEEAEFSVFKAGRYSFSRVMENLGKLGEDLLSLHEIHKEDDRAKLSMMTLINFIKTKG